MTNASANTAVAAASRELIARGSSDYNVLIHGLCSGMTSYCALNDVDAAVRVVRQDGIDLYVAIEHNAADLTAMAQLARVLQCRLPEGWNLYFDDNFIAAVPPFLLTEEGLAWLTNNFWRSDDLANALCEGKSDKLYMGLYDLSQTGVWKSNPTRL